MANLHVDIQNYDIPRVASVYFDSEGNRCWTKAWFCGREKGEPAVEISRRQAISFIDGTISKDSWLSHFYPKQMSTVQSSIAKTTQYILGF